MTDLILNDSSKVVTIVKRLNLRVTPSQGGYIPGSTEPDVIRPFPRIFLVLADAFCVYLNDGGEMAEREVFRFDMQVFSLCIAGGLDQHNWIEMSDAENYIRRSLGWEFDLSDRPVQPKIENETTQKVEIPGHLYILRNQSLVGMVKIGYTTQKVVDRIRQLSGSTSIPMPFELVAAFKTPTPIAHEFAVHRQLADHRMPGREFFVVDELGAIAACKAVISGII